MIDRISELEGNVRDLKLALVGWRTAVNERVFMKVEDKHKQWFLDLLAETRRLLEEELDNV
jgi:hypothetical protein